ncbi:MAG TPA: hypothetical protein VLC98_01650 [Phnomibacter sp.]|nr:hypothetical protein [Phnomibacter sp.]
MATTLKTNYLQPVSSAHQTFETICQMAGIQLNGADSTNSLASKGFKPCERYVLGENGTIQAYKDIR